MVCSSCFEPCLGPVCGACRLELRRSSDRILAGGIRLITAFDHAGPAVTLIHGLKYRGELGYAELVAQVLAPQLPRAPLVAVPRALSRLVRYGVDPASEIARRIGRLKDAPVLDLLARPIHSLRRAGRSHATPAPPLRLKRDAVIPVLVVDDVCTTGATLLSAARAIGTSNVLGVIAANDAVRGSTLSLDVHTNHSKPPA